MKLDQFWVLNWKMYGALCVYLTTSCVGVANASSHACYCWRKSIIWGLCERFSDLPTLNAYDTCYMCVENLLKIPVFIAFWIANGIINSSFVMSETALCLETTFSVAVACFEHWYTCCAVYVCMFTGLLINNRSISNENLKWWMNRLSNQLVFANYFTSYTSIPWRAMDNRKSLRIIFNYMNDSFPRTEMSIIDLAVAIRALERHFRYVICIKKGARLSRWRFDGLCKSYTRTRFDGFLNGKSHVNDVGNKLQPDMI